MSKSRWASQAGIGQSTFANWVLGAATEGASDAPTSGVEFVRLKTGAVGAAWKVGDADGGTEVLHGEMTLENGELRIVARRGTRWSDLQRMVELLRSAR